MDKKKLDYFRKRLETRQQDLRRMVSRTEQDGRSVDEGSAQDIADRAASSYNKEFLFHQSNADRQLLQMVETALSRIREGSFGERKSTPSVWKLFPGLATASSAKRSSSRDCWKNSRDRSHLHPEICCESHHIGGFAISGDPEKKVCAGAARRKRRYPHRPSHLILKINSRGCPELKTGLRSNSLISNAQALAA
jgi:RNA polymerase-binding transcription factor